MLAIKISQNMTYSTASDMDDVYLRVTVGSYDWIAACAVYILYMLQVIRLT